MFRPKREKVNRLNERKCVNKPNSTQTIIQLVLNDYIAFYCNRITFHYVYKTYESLDTYEYADEKIIIVI